MPPLIPPSTADLDRRAALKLLAGSVAITLAGCSKPHEEIVPYVDMPERTLPGEPLKFATTLTLAGYGRGVMAISVDGRPIKIEGNPRHPASLGATDVFAEAEIMSLYDPGRTKAPRHGDDITSWEAFADALGPQMEREHSHRGAGLRLVTGRITSPTLLRQINDLLRKFPEARWYRYEPVSDDAVTAGATLAYGRPLTALPRLAEASVILTLDADPLGPGPQQITHARAFTQRRKANAPFSRLYAVEPDWSLTGANADHRLALPPQAIGSFAMALDAALRGEPSPVPLAPPMADFLRAAAADLAANKGHAVVLAGPRQPADVQALCHWINAQLQAPVGWIDPVDTNTLGHTDTLKAFAEELRQGRVETLLIAGANPAYDLPSSLGVAEGLKRVAFSAHLGLHDDETAALCQWHLPLAHTLESWSDQRAFDGTASIVQPLIRPLYDTRTMHELIAMAAGDLTPSPYELVRQTWAEEGKGNFDGWWRNTLHDGVIADSAAKTVVAAARQPEVKPAQLSAGLCLLLGPDAATWDGRYANNPWLQECPRPLTKEVWGNSIALAPVDAARLGITDGDVIDVTHGGYTLRGPVRITQGVADGVITTTLGYGRSRAGAIGNAVGFDVSALRSPENPWLIENVTISPTGKHHAVPSTQHQFKLEGDTEDLFPVLSLAQLARGKKPAGHEDENKPSLLSPVISDTYAWAMVIDTAACIGCNACVVACQSENNVPVVGPEEIARGRDMHWLRIDTYVESARPGFQPVPCMHCEHAPCEPVCPVAASVHDGEGLNVQVYNRCIGTRFCQANCPYKVRRFNYFGYADGQEYGGLDAEVVKAAHNPDVSVRARGVMEKCTYCVQRISRARRIAEKEDRSIAEGEVVTACQAACPTQAIYFGDRSDIKSQVNSLRGAAHHYALLGHLGTRPRTTYLARLRNPNPALQEPDT